VCPPWCTRTHDDGGDTVEDGIMHISEAVVWDMPLNRPFPVMQFDLGQAYAHVACPGAFVGAYGV
jgi:hypothetical protein